MATRIIGGNPGYSLEAITDYAGSATTSHNVELTVDWSTTIVSDNGSTRPIQKLEVFLLLDLFVQYIERMTTWPNG
jgi:hypothetical protein